MEDLKDIEITCIDCNKPFVFTASEQRYFKDRNLFQPKRCPDCRKLRKARLQNNPPQPISSPEVSSLIGEPPKDSYHRQKEDWRHGEGRSKHHDNF